MFEVDGVVMQTEYCSSVKDYSGEAYYDDEDKQLILKDITCSVIKIFK